jgi:hypothetical protein
MDSRGINPGPKPRRCQRPQERRKHETSDSAKQQLNKKLNNQRRIEHIWRIGIGYIKEVQTMLDILEAEDRSVVIKPKPKKVACWACGGYGGTQICVCRV